MNIEPATRVDAQHSLVMVEGEPWRTWLPVRQQWWLLRDTGMAGDVGVPVAFLSTLTYASKDQMGAEFVICDIEVRPEYRGQGLTRVLVGAVEAAKTLPLWTTGGFTPLGAQALGWVPVIPGDTAGVKYGNQTFIKDWDSMHPLNLL